MSLFTTGADFTLKSNNIPAAFLELIQRAVDNIASAPVGTIVTCSYTQFAAAIAVTIPAKSVFNVALPAAPIQRPTFMYAGVEVAEEAVPALWKCKLPDRSGQVAIERSISSAIMAAGYLLKDAERIAPVPATGQGITAIGYNDQTQQFTIQASIPVKIANASSGRPQVTATDYVAATASYADLIAIS